MSWPDAEFDLRLKRILWFWIALCAIELLLVIWPGDGAVAAWSLSDHWIAANRDSILRMTNWGNYPFYTLFLLVLWRGWQRDHTGMRHLAIGYVVAQLIGPVLIVRALKMLIGRARPIEVCDAVCQWTWLGPTGKGAFHSFPSGHMADAITSALFVGFLLKDSRSGALVFCWAAAIGFTRVALAQHYPSDILAGTLIGGMVSLLILRWASGRARAPSVPVAIPRAMPSHPLAGTSIINRDAA